jgi:simple sugar transport system permease protein
MGALIYAVLTVTFMANQNVTGLTLSIFGVGLANFIGEYMLTHTNSASLKLPEGITAAIANIYIEGLSDLPVIGHLFFRYNPFVYLGILVAVLCAFYLNHTKTGLNLKAVGENPAAADAVGIKVTKMKYVNVLIGGGICGIGGAYTSMIINGGVWMSNSVNGMGWIAVALVIFASWSPLRAIFGSYIFGAFNILKYYMPKTWFSLPNAFYDMLPFIITALVLIVTSMRKSKENAQPASCGVNYFREER